MNILYEDESLLVIDKPSGWIVNDADTTKDQPTVQQWLIANGLWPLAKDLEYRSGIVHRLDKETSGCLIIAKTRESFEILQEQFKARIIKKQYCALVHGKVENQEGEIKAEVGRLPWRRDRFGVLSGGRDSQTRYSVLKRYLNPQTNESLTLVQLNPKTGRTHQIRIHMKYIGHPLVADQFYAGRKTSRKDRKWCPRLFLHASKIMFTHPESKKKIEVESKLPQDLSIVLSGLMLENQ